MAKNWRECDNCKIPLTKSKRVCPHCGTYQSNHSKNPSLASKFASQEISSRKLDTKDVVEIAKSNISSELKEKLIKLALDRENPVTDESFEDRDTKIVEMIMNGFTLQEAGDKFGISRERARQIFKTTTGGAVGGYRLEQARADVIRSTRHRVEKACELCGKTFEVPDIWAERTKYCSEKCKREMLLYRNYEMRVCKNCGVNYLTPRRGSERKEVFCGKRCQGEFTGKHYGFQPKTRKERVEERRKKFRKGGIYYLSGDFTKSEYWAKLGISPGQGSKVMKEGLAHSLIHHVGDKVYRFERSFKPILKKKGEKGWGPSSRGYVRRSKKETEKMIREARS